MLKKSISSENFKGANQSSYAIASSESNIQYLGGKDAGPCTLIFIHGLSDDVPVGACIHFTIQNDIKSLDKVLQRMGNNLSIFKSH